MGYIVLNDISDLVAYSTPSTNEVYLVKDGNRGGLFYYDTSSFTVNDGTVFASTSSGYYIRMFDGDINLRWFDVNADGVNDDSAALQTAIDLAWDDLGDFPGQSHTLYIPKGTYLIEEQIFIQGNVNIRGEGKASVLKLRMSSKVSDSIVLGGKKPPTPPDSQTESIIWTGMINGIFVDAYNSNNGNTFNVLKGVNYIFHNVFVENSALVSIKGAVNNDYSTPPSRDCSNGIYSKVTIKGDSSSSKAGITIASKGVNFNFKVKNFVIKNCNISQLTDDAIATHEVCMNMNFRNNNCFETARILVNNSKNIIVSKNRVLDTLIDEAQNPAHIACSLEGATNSDHIRPENIIISKNIMTKPASDKGPVFTTAFGVNKLIYNYNHLINKQLDEEYKLVIAFNGRNWSKKNLPDPPIVREIREVMLVGNLLENAYISNAHNSGYVITSNYVNGGYVRMTEKGLCGINSVKEHSDENIIYDNVTYQVRPDNRLEYIGTVPANNTSDFDLAIVHDNGTFLIEDYINLDIVQVVGFEVRVENSLLQNLDVSIVIDDSLGTHTYTKPLINGTEKELFNILTTSQQTTEQNSKIRVKGKLGTQISNPEDIIVIVHLAKSF